MYYGNHRVRRRSRYRVRPRFFVNMVILLLCASGFVLLLNRLYFPAQHAGTGAGGKPAKQQKNDLPLASPDPTTTEGAAPTASASHEADNGSVAVLAQQDWRLKLVNSIHPLPQNFAVQTAELPNGLQIDARVRDDLMNMIHDGKQQGLDFVLCSAYRTVQKQQELFLQQVDVEKGKGSSQEEAERVTATKVAIPGTSEHNLGLAVDIVAKNYQKLDEGYLQTPECAWLTQHCCEYGFIVRYPQGKSEITKIIFEPWHFRYVGVDAAKEIMQKGLCLEEYLGETK